MAVPTSYTDIAVNEARHRVLVARLPDDLERGEQYSTLGVLDAQGWTRLDLNLRARSIATFEKDTWVVGNEGEVLTLRQGADRILQQLPDSGHSDGRRLGPPRLVRRIGGKLFVCGYAGQVYTQNKKGDWVHMDAGLVETGKVGAKSIALEGLGGTSPEDVYVCGTRGLLAHWNGSAWTKIPVRTNVHLWALRAFAPDDVWVVGSNGVVIRGDGKSTWATEVIPGAEEATLSDVERYQGKTYVAGVGNLWEKGPHGWAKVRHGLEKGPRTDFYSFALGEEKLWVMGTKRLHSFDGKVWQAHIDANNG